MIRFNFAALALLSAVCSGTIAQGKTMPCHEDQRFFLDADVTNVDYTACPESRPDSAGATLSFDSDRTARIDTGTIHASLGFMLVPPLDPKGPRRGFELFGLSDVAVLGFVSADGSLSSDGTSQGLTRLGVDLATTWETGQGQGLLFHRFNATLYALSDMRLAASGYGVSLGYIPSNFHAHLNLYTPGTPPPFDYRVNLSLVLDGKHVDRAGETGLADHTDYLWLGSNFGFEARMKPAFLPKPITAALDIAAFDDLRSGNTAVLSSVSLSLPVDEQGHANLAISYRKGRDRLTLQDGESVSVGLTLNF